MSQQSGRVALPHLLLPVLVVVLLLLLLLLLPGGLCGGVLLEVPEHTPPFGVLPPQPRGPSL